MSHLSPEYRGPKDLAAIAMQKRLFTPDEAAAYLGLATSTLARLRVKGGGPAYLKVLRRIRYLKDDLDAWLVARRRFSTSVAEHD